MIEVVPACIPQTFDELAEKASTVKGLASMIQMDVVDGIFAPSRTWPYNRSSDPTFAKIILEEGGLPQWEDIDYELDMLVAEPEKKIDDWIKAGITSAVVHFESTKRIEEVIEKARYFDIKIGLAFNPSTSNEEIFPYIEEVDFLQFMGNDKIGYNGVELDRKVLKKIAEMHKEYPDITLAIDIGVNPDTAPLLVDAGITKLISGSAIFESADIEGTIEYFESLG